MKEMKRILTLSAAIGLVLTGLSVFAADRGVAAAKPELKGLTEILRQVEARPDFAALDGVDFDADDGVYYEIEYVTDNGGRVEVKINAATGKIKRVERKFNAIPEAVLAY